MPQRLILVVITGLLTMACGSPAPAEQPRSTPPAPQPAPAASVTVVPNLDPPGVVPNLDPPGVERPGAVWPPPGYDPPPCELELSTVAVRRGASYDVTAYVKNVSPQSVTLELPDRCPQGPATFYGLPGNRDYHQACMKGACVEQRVLRFTAAPGERIQIDTVSIDPAGGSCNPPLPEGRHHVAFTIPFGGATCPGTWAGIGEPKKELPVPPLPKTRPDPGVKCPRMPVCGLACPGGGLARDERGCPLCACEERRGTLPGAPPP